MGYFKVVRKKRHEMVENVSLFWSRTTKVVFLFSPFQIGLLNDPLFSQMITLNCWESISFKQVVKVGILKENGCGIYLSFLTNAEIVKSCSSSEENCILMVEIFILKSFLYVRKPSELFSRLVENTKKHINMRF